MAQEKAKRPQSAKSRTLPPDVTSLIAMFRTVHRELLQRGEHLKREHHDFRARRGFQTLFGQRAACWARIAELDPRVAEQLRLEFNLTFSQQEVA